MEGKSFGMFITRGNPTVMITILRVRPFRRFLEVGIPLSKIPSKVVGRFRRSPLKAKLFRMSIPRGNPNMRSPLQRENSFRRCLYNNSHHDPLIILIMIRLRGRPSRGSLEVGIPLEIPSKVVGRFRRSPLKAKLFRMTGNPNMRSRLRGNMFRISLYDTSHHDP